MTNERPDGADTIVAMATPPGRGGIGVVRLSGPRAAAIAARLFAPRIPGSGAGAGAGHATLGRFVSARGETIDEGYLVIFRPPRAFTGEETAEIWAHGSPPVLRRLVEEAVARGARPATPGEFALRAFLNGRIDLTEAEAIRDLIEARTAFQARAAIDQVFGRISGEVNRQKERVADLLARLEAAIEFSEEAEAERFAPDGGVARAIEATRRDLERLAGTFTRGRQVREGWSAAIVGATNVGKSSLFNRLLEDDRAIVTPLPGTTRDPIEESIDLGGLMLRLTDTAGLFDPPDEAAAEAVRRADACFEVADLIVAVLDWSRPFAAAEGEMLRRLDGRRAIVVLNKIDLPCGLPMDRILYLRKRHGVLEVSARTGEGISDLRKRLQEAASALAPVAEEPFLTNVRHRDLVVRAAASLGRAAAALEHGPGEECAAIDLREALDRLGEITGAVGLDRIYERIFSTFCIGK